MACTYHFYEVAALREIDPEPVVYLNRKESAKRGLKDGDYVKYSTIAAIA